MTVSGGLFLEIHGGSSGEDFIGQSPDVVHKGPTAVSISLICP
jgi:hypothetical protein